MSMGFPNILFPLSMVRRAFSTSGIGIDHAFRIVPTVLHQSYNLTVVREKEKGDDTSGRER